MTFATITTHTFTDDQGRTFELEHGEPIHAVADDNASIEGCIEVRYVVQHYDCADPIADTDLADLEPWTPDGIGYTELEDMREWVAIRKTRNVFPVRIGSGHGPFSEAEVCDDTAEGFRRATHLLALNHTEDMAADRDDHRPWAESTMDEWQKWANGDTYGLVRETFDAETLERIAGDDWPSYDACWGFIGLEYATESCDSGEF